MHANMLASDIFSEFDGKDYEEEVFDGDVKYHLGWTSDRLTAQCSLLFVLEKYYFFPNYEDYSVLHSLKY